MQNDEISYRVVYSVVHQWIAAFNAHDVAALLSLYSPSAELFDAGMKRPRRGHVAIENWFQRRFRAMPTIAYTPTSDLLVNPGALVIADPTHDLLNANVPAQEQQVAVTWTASGRSPRLLGQSWLSRSFQVDGVSIFLLRNTLIVRQRGYYDHLSVIQQIIPPLKWFLPVRL